MESKKYYYCQFQIETDKEACGNQCSHCRNYYYPLEQERKMEDLKEWVEGQKALEPDFQEVLNKIQVGIKEPTLKGRK